MAAGGYAGRRQEWLEAMGSRVFDVLIVGGGITGAGVARDAALAGLRVALVEQGDFASGTSSRSTKLFHGGLRYLEHGEIGLVAKAGRERERMEKLGRHLVTPLVMNLPVYRGETYALPAMAAAVWAYDRLAGVPRSRRRSLWRPGAESDTGPGFRRSGLDGVIRYHELRTDDARTTLAVLRAGLHEGALAVNYARVTQMVHRQGRVVGAMVEDLEAPDRRTYCVRARYVVNAAGPWVEDLLALDAGRTSGPGQERLMLSRGIHIVVPWSRLPVGGAWSLPTPDRRLVFVVPHEDVTYVGTTDEPYTGPLDAPPVPNEEVRYLLDVVNRHFLDVGLDPGDVMGRWAGIRPLIRSSGRRSADLSRRDTIWVSDSGLITVAGGKLTAWRQMAETVVTTLYRAERRAGGRFPVTRRAYVQRSRATTLPGHPAETLEEWAPRIARQLVVRWGISEQDGAMLARRYGAEAPNVLASSENASPAQTGRLVPSVPLLACEVAYLFDQEMVLHLADLVVRRTGLGWFGGPPAQQALPQLAARVGALVGWDGARVNTEVERTQRAAYWPTAAHPDGYSS